jgi:AAA domain
MLEHILHELGIPTDGAGKFTKLQRLHEFLLEHTRSGGNAAILLDEAQDLDARVLEELRLLSNLETGTEKILQILLAGQPEFERKLAQPALRQLRQRIALHVRLRALAPLEVSAYVRSRLERAGAQDGALFAPDALARIAEVTEGIPRLVNILCDSCLAAGSKQITGAIVEEAWADYAALSSPHETSGPALAETPVPVASPHVLPPAAPLPRPEIPGDPPPRVPEPPLQASDDIDALDDAPDDRPPPSGHSWRVAAWLLAAASTLAAASAMWAMGPRLLALVR